MTKRKNRGSEWPKTVTAGHATLTLYRHAHATNKSGHTYVLAWRTPTGRRREKFADEEAAMKEARLKATHLSHGKIGSASMTSSDRDELRAAREITAGTPLLAALAEWAKVREITRGQAIPAAEAWAARNVTTRERVRVDEVVSRFLKSKRAAGIQTEKNHGHIFVDVREKFGADFIDAVSAAKLDVWLASKSHPSTRHTFRKHVIGLWRWAQSQNIVPREFKTEAEHTQRVTIADQKRETITAPTLRKLLAHIGAEHAEYLPALVVAAFCGLRRSEVHAQTWEQIDLAGRTLTVTKAKHGTAAERTVPLCRAAVSWLMLCADRTGNLCGNFAMDRIRDIGRTAGLTLPENCFRHSFCTYRSRLTTVAQTADEAGNSPTILRKHYRKLTDKTMARAWFESAPGQIGEIVAMPQRKAANA